MGRLDIILDDELETKFRRAVAERIGFKKGNISTAVEEAIKDWLRKKVNI